MFFVDCEASSLSSDSYPIEIGWVDVFGQGESYLIQPEPHWTDWDTRAEAIHRVRRETLVTTGTPATQVARRVQTVFEKATLISDNPAYERYWINRLLEVIGGQSPTIYDFNMLVSNEIHRITELITVPPDSSQYHRQSRHLLDEAQVIATGIIDQHNLAGGHRHRAQADAEHLWRMIKAIKAAIDKRIKSGA